MGGGGIILGSPVWGSRHILPSKGRSLGLQVYDRGLSRVWGLPKVTKVPEMR